MANHTSTDRGERAADASAKIAPSTEASSSSKSEGPAPAKPEIAEKPIGVERLTHTDVNEVCALYKRVWDGQKGELSPDMVKAWEPSPLEFTSWMEGVTYFAARRGSRLVGVIGLEISQGSGRILHLAVEPDGRRQGVATALIRATIEWARRANCPSIWVDILARFTTASAVFDHLGFQKVGTLHRHEWNEDVHFFELLL